MGKVIDRVRQRAREAERRRIQATYQPTEGLRGFAAGRERALNHMTDRILENRQKHPRQTVHAAAVRTHRGVSQLTVGVWIPADGIRACLAAQLDAINASAGVR